jgi:hypothetical protein
MFIAGLNATEWSSESDDNAPLNSEEKLLSLGAVDDLYEAAGDRRKRRNIDSSPVSPKRSREVKKVRKTVVHPQDVEMKKGRRVPEAAVPDSGLPTGSLKKKFLTDIFEADARRREAESKFQEAKWR